jgi:hypothetical protein
MHPTLKEIVKDIQLKFPTDKPVRLIVAPTLIGPGYGYCEILAREKQIESYTVYVKESRIVTLMVESFIHEWAHVLDIDKNGLYRKKAHRSSWGKEYARLWQHFEDNFGVG